MTKLLLLLFFTLNVVLAQEIQTSAQLVRVMHDRYFNNWYKTLTFVQKTTQYRSDTTIATWYEAFSFPGTMRIDMDSMGSDGLIISNDSLYYFRNGSLSTTRYFVHPLLLLGFDLYLLPPEKTIDKLKTLHFDLSVIHEDEWQGRPAFVAGAKKGDLHSPQFWVDKERMYFVRLLEPTGQEGKQTRETQFNKYVPIAGGWIAAEVIFKVEDRVFTTEEYSEIRANPPLDPKLFEPLYWKTTRWR